ncbi:MAG: hypothetical protein KBS83_06330, partial [Lachnospiraceae bacterium]|nr:hypothetical protein [Candidatus Equihabitans merdae]
MSDHSVRNISIEEWTAMAAQGIDIPVRIQLHGYSMQPLIRRMRDYVTIVPVDREMMVGDVVLF